MTRALMFLLLLAAASQARAQDDAVQRIYAAMEPRIRAEYEFHLAGVARQVLGTGAPVNEIELFQRRLKMLAYNRAVLVALHRGDREGSAAQRTLCSNGTKSCAHDMRGR